MTEPLVLVVLLGTSVDPSAESMLATVRRAFGPEATVLADTSSAPSDADALEIGERVHARAVARVTWANADGAVARLHVHVAPSPSSDWTDQEIDFGPQDSTSEKGRTVGNALAAMVERLERDRQSEAEQAAPRPVSPPPEPVLAPQPVRPKASWERFEVFALGVGALGSGVTGIGGAAGARWWAMPNLGFRLAAGARLGSIDVADAKMTSLFVGGGPGYRIRLGDFEFGARADVLVVRHAVTRELAVETTRTRWVGALDIVFEGSWALGSRVGILVGAGPEFALGTTEIDIGGVRKADIASVRGVAELGLRIRF